MASGAARLTQPLRLWELAGAEPTRVFSPYVWRVRLVLAHKGIEYESTTWRYNDKRLIAPAQKVGSIKGMQLVQELQGVHQLFGFELSGPRFGCREVETRGVSSYQPVH